MDLLGVRLSLLLPELGKSKKHGKIQIKTATLIPFLYSVLGIIYRFTRGFDKIIEIFRYIASAIIFILFLIAFIYCYFRMKRSFDKFGEFQNFCVESYSMALFIKQLS